MGFGICIKMAATEVVNNLPQEGQQGSEFTAESVRQMLNDALAKQAEQYEGKIESVKIEARRQIRALGGYAKGDVVAEFVSAGEAKSIRDERDYSELSKLFGPKADCEASNKLALSDKTTWRKLRARAEEVGLIAPTPQLGRRLQEYGPVDKR